ncbi:MAG: hypothetical protein L0J48_02655 [Alkalibacterium sp.]|uniref:Uncharacterized protein n=1 Tax=Alkalibacterium gilvum TaxID=1130080 RepID=A0A1H6RQF3_9LACT|nr:MULTISPECIES: hypothetical protein [Alkalibacterium]MDN6193972.1 hypothetical protein [Alkalibacterium sp.]MDN6293429.1 hypothetical protein [Alkalibacterium sp.]MDN6296104.1 hypothetical protein [Alkalibacterium sp.]MDN6326907.1 hypothetical protein [Alkalibacterium sp.]MDN6385686.1 hypothetical protein [Alkalibacterium sp.]
MKKRFIYKISTPNESKELLIREHELIKNADGELDCPLDLVLRRYNLNWDDLFKMQVSKVSLIKEDANETKVIRSISFKHLYHFKKCKNIKT